MNTWRHLLQADPMPWLLDPENPSVRYWTLVDILEKPAAGAEVQEAQRAIARLPLVQEIFDRQQPAGHWGEDATKPYTAAGTLGALSMLYTLGVTPDERTTAGCEAFLRYAQHHDGGFSMVKTQRSGVFPCTTGQHLPMLVYFGLGDDPRVQQAIVFLIGDMARPDALDCARYSHQPCLWGAIAALDGLAVLRTVDLPRGAAARVVQQLADTLLSAPYDFDGEHKRWLTFGVPRAWDLLSALLVLATHAYGHDPRFGPLLERVLARQDAQGRWMCGSTSRTWPLEPRNRPSKWVTLDVLRMLKRREQVPMPTTT